MTFDASYREELAFLRDMGRAVALRQPGLCDTLASPGSDPDVERLLEGFAFLAARTRERADDAIPEAIESIAEVVAPHALRPVPASTVMELTPRAGLVRDHVLVTKGAAFGSRPIEGERCELRSTADVVLRPIAIERVVLDRNQPRSPRLVVSLRAPTAAMDLAYARRPLRLFLHAPLANASTLALAIDRHLRGVSIRTGNVETPLGKTARLTDPDREPHLPWPDESPEGARHLVELAYFPERHLFFDVTGLEHVPAAARTEAFDLCLEFEPDAPLPATLAADAVRLHCVPAINVFPRDAEPITWRDELRDVPLRAAGLPPDHIEVFDVSSVIGLAEGPRARHTYRPFATFDYVDDERRAGFFALRRARSALDGGVDTFLRVGGRPTRATESLSIEMRCTNRSRVSKLRAGEVCEPIAGSPSVASFTNIAAMGPRSSSPIGSEVLHAIVGLSAVGHGPRLTPSALRAWLGTCSVSPGVDVARARACASLAGAISAVHARPSRAARRGVVERGITIDLELEEARLPSLGEAFLLTRALDRALATELPLNVRQRVSSVLRPSGATIVLDPRAGLP